MTVLKIYQENHSASHMSVDELQSILYSYGIEIGNPADEIRLIYNDRIEFIYFEQNSTEPFQVRDIFSTKESYYDNETPDGYDYDKYY